MEKLFTIEDIKRAAFASVQYASKLENQGASIIKKEHIDHFVEFEVGIVDDFKPPIDGFNWFGPKANKS